MGRIGIYGGTFNPPHRGHISAARQVIDLLNLDKLLVIPAATPPHKALPEDSPTAWQRLELVRMAFERIDKVQVSDMELRRAGRSYTVDTVEQIHRMFPEDRLYLVMGTDMFLSFCQWYQPDAICRYATLAVMLREIRDTELRAQMNDMAQRIRTELGGQVEFLENDILPMSSTDVRRMTVFGASDRILPENVCGRIRELGLYGAGRNYRNLPGDELERVVVSLLNPKRVAHVLGCRDTAVELAKRHGADPRDAARAGLLHDVTKALPLALQELLCQIYPVSGERYSRENPKTLHALTGELVARNVFGENDAVSRAIGSHTTGCAGMDTLQKIIYIADYMEPNRDFPGVETLRELAFTDLDRAVLTGLWMTAQQLREQGRVITENSLNAIAWLESRLMVKS